jgi:hypothetical protein
MLTFWIFLIVSAVLILVGLFIFTQGCETLGTSIVTIGVMVIVFLIMSSAKAHDHSRPNLDDWFGSLQSQYGTCCGGPKVDATTLDGPHWDGKDGKYRVFVEQQWVQVPDGAVLHQPNKDGRTLVWFTVGYGGIITVRCFIPGLMT